MSMSIESLVKEFEEFLGDKPYFTRGQLINIGLWGSSTAAATALKRGDLPSIKVSPKRTVIPRSAVLQYFRKNLIQNNIESGGNSIPVENAEA
jgi:hypothetical protein